MAEKVVLGRAPMSVQIAGVSSISRILMFERCQQELFRARDVNGPAKSTFRHLMSAAWHLGRIRLSEHYANKEAVTSSHPHPK